VLDAQADRPGGKPEGAGELTLRQPVGVTGAAQGGKQLKGGDGPGNDPPVGDRESLPAAGDGLIVEEFAGSNTFQLADLELND
jgi:hypothetical protein